MTIYIINSSVVLYGSHTRLLEEDEAKKYYGLQINFLILCLNETFSNLWRLKCVIQYDFELKSNICSTLNHIRTKNVV